MALELTKENFDREVLQSDKPVLIDFWASWCMPCRMVAPTVEEVAKENADTVKVCKINVDDQPELAAKFGIMSIPTLMVIKDGKVVNSSVGAKSKQAILNMIG